MYEICKFIYARKIKIFSKSLPKILHLRNPGSNVEKKTSYLYITHRKKYTVQQISPEWCFWQQILSNINSKAMSHDRWMDALTVTVRVKARVTLPTSSWIFYTHTVKSANNPLEPLGKCATILMFAIYILYLDVSTEYVQFQIIKI